MGSELRLGAIAIPGEPDPWSALGFGCDAEGRVPFANGAIAPGADIASLVVAGLDASIRDVDGVIVSAGPVVDAAEHPNGAFEIDHVVVMTDALERTSAAIAGSLGLEQRRLRETDTVRQAFHRFPDQGGSRGCIIEVVENARVDRPALWGVVVNVRDLDAAVAVGADLVGDPKPAVQPGRRIATVRSSAGLGVAVALMTPA